MHQEDNVNIEESKPIVPLASRGRWWFHLLLLAAYPIALGIIPSLMGDRKGVTLLPKNTSGLLLVMGMELSIFALVFAFAWLASRASRDQLLLRWRQGIRPIWAGFVYSIGLRVLIAIALMAVAVAAFIAHGADPETLNKLRPRTEVVVDPEALTRDPIYFLLTLTFVSFVVAGLREELWRAAILAGLGALFPQWYAGIRGQLAAVTIAAVIFGLGHLPQGWAGCGVTAVLGWGLGIIMIRHDSIWEAVFAHGFFNATTFLLLYWLSLKHPDMLPG
jgi:membrane protease YdiL (CAAX protease family)